MLVINEKSGREFTAAFFDAGYNASLPATVHYWLDCETTGTVLIDWTAITPEMGVDANGSDIATATIVIPGSASAIQKSTNRQELKTLLVVSDKDTDGEFSQTYQYYVRNLRGRS